MSGRSIIGRSGQGLRVSTASPDEHGLARGIGERAEIAFCFLALSTFLGAYATIPLRLQGIDPLGGESNPFNAASLFIILIGTIVLIAANWRRFLAVARLGGPVNAFVALAVASSLWSSYPAISLRKSLALLQIVLFGYYLVARFPMERVIRLLSWVFATAFVLSIVLALAVPDIGVMHEDELSGDWCGVFAHKSALGEASILGTICFAWRWAHEPGRRVLNSGGILLCVVLAVMSGSKTAQLTIVLLGPIAVGLRLLRLPGLGKLWAGFLMATALVTLAAIMFFFFTELTAAVGKDATLTGRIPVWQSLLGFAFQHPLGGYGYTAFFVAENPDVENVWRHGGWEMWDSHSTFIGMLVELGIPGLLLSQWVLLGAIWRSLRAFSADTVPWAGFAASYLICFALISLVEMIMFRGDLHSAILPMVYVALRQQGGGVPVAAVHVAAPWPVHARMAAAKSSRPSQG